MIVSRRNGNALTGIGILTDAGETDCHVGLRPPRNDRKNELSALNLVLRVTKTMSLRTSAPQLRANTISINSIVTERNQDALVNRSGSSRIRRGPCLRNDSFPDYAQAAHPVGRAVLL